MRSIVGQVVIRVAGLLVLYGLFQALAWVSASVLTQDDGLGIGLLNFAATALLSAGWGFVDGRRYPLLGVLLRWLVVALLTAMGTTIVLAQLGGATGTFLGRIGLYVELIPFTVGLVLVPAIVGAALGFAVASSRPPRSSGADR